MLASLLPALALAVPASAQHAYEIQVYGSRTAEPGRLFAELHSNTALRGPLETADGLQPDEGAYHETLELTRGFTDVFETGLYVFSSARSGEGWDWVGAHVRPRVRAPDSWGWPVGASLSAELGYLRPRFSGSRWDVELRPILDWRSGRLYAAVNPAFERGLREYRGRPALEFAPAAKLTWDALRRAAFGLEYYGATGPVDRWAPAREQAHQLYLVGDLLDSPDWELEGGVGTGLTRATDRWALKLIVGRRL